MVQHKRWKKGQSSSSNPALRRHRDVVKNNIFNYKTSNRKNPLTSNSFLNSFLLTRIKWTHFGRISETRFKIIVKSKD